MMRRIVYLGLLCSTACAGVVYLVGSHACRHPNCLLARCCGIAPGAEDEHNLHGEQAACAPDEPRPINLNALLPDPAQLTSDWQLSEPINLLPPLDSPNSVKQEAAGKQLRCAVPETVVPAAAIQFADEAECFRLMPHCETAERLSVMPQPEGTAESELNQDGSEEQEDQQGVSSDDSKAIEERLQRILRSYLQGGEGRPGIDTLEFRPSDAKKGEFDRIPF